MLFACWYNIISINVNVNLFAVSHLIVHHFSNTLAKEETDPKFEGTSESHQVHSLQVSVLNVSPMNESPVNIYQYFDTDKKREGTLKTSSGNLQLAIGRTFETLSSN